MRCVGVEYLDYPTVEWTLYFKNTGSKDTPLIENIKALDTQFKRGPDSEFLLHHSLGSSCRIDDYKPLESVLPPKTAKRFAPLTGYSSDPDMPYFNVESGSGEGVIVVVGWPGQWAAEFARDGADGLRRVGRPGDDPVHAPSRRRGQDSVDRAAVLARRLDTFAEHLAKMDARLQRAQARRKAAADDGSRDELRHLRLHRHDRGEPEAVHRPLGARGLQRRTGGGSTTDGTRT